MSIEAMKQALEALYMANTRQCPGNKIGAAINALSAAIEQSEKQEPVAWQATADKCQIQTVPAKGGLLPTTPPVAPRQWVGLTDEEVHEGFCHVEYETPNDWNTDPDDWCQQFARYLEAKLKEKNA